MLAISDAYRAGLLKGNNLWRNIIAGVIVGIVAVPLSMAFAIASGAKPEQGLYTAIVAAFFVAVFGGSRVQIAGPTGAFIVVLAHITATYGISGLQIATIMAGLLLILMGIVKLGNVIKFIPDPVIVGFTSGIACIIFVGEWKDFLGLSYQLPLSAAFYQKLLAALISLPTLNPMTTALAFASLLLVIYTPRFFKQLPGPLVAMVVATSLQMIFHFPIATLGTMFGGIPHHLPNFQIPTFTLHELLGLIGPAFTIAMLGAIESLLSATAADGMAGTRHQSNQELIGQGLANIFAPLFGGFAATGAIARTVTNVRHGGNCAVSAIVHSIFLILVIIVLAPLAAYVPLCALAAILFVVAYNMSDLPYFVHIVKSAPRSDVIVLITTFLLTVFTNLVMAVNVGVILAMLFFIRRMSKTIDIDQRSVNEFQAELSQHGLTELPQDTIVYTIQGPFFFGAAEKIEHALAVTNSDPKAIIFRLKNVPFIDMTGLATLKDVIEEYCQRGVKVYICEANPRVQRKLANFGILQTIDGNCVFNTLIEAVQAEVTTYCNLSYT